MKFYSVLLIIVLIFAIQFSYSEQKKQMPIKVTTHPEKSELNNELSIQNNEDSISTLATFTVITSTIDPPLAPGDNLGIRGSIPPLDWSTSLGMSNLDEDSTFETSVPFDPIYMEDTLEYKFVVERSGGNIQWEDSVGSGDAGNRVLEIPGGLFELPLVHFNSAEVSFPVASDDFILTSEDSSTTISVMTNDYDPNNDPISITNITQPANGQTQLDPGDTTITYLPNAQFYGVDIFSYTITDATNKSDTAMVSVTVLPNIDTTQVLVYENDFEGEIGSEWINTSTDSTPIGARKFLGQFGNETVSLTLDSLQAHISITLSFDLFIIRSWDGNDPSPILGPDIWELNHSSGSILLHTTFRNSGIPGITQAYPDDYPGGIYPSRTGTTENMTLGYDLYGDAVYNLSFIFPHTSNTFVLDFVASGLQEITDESWGIDNISVYVKPDSVTLIENIDKIPEHFQLSQNYPNPFNPSTRIQYAISSRQFVTLRIYDVLGKEIATPVNEEKSAGTYVVEFDASELTSGIYFYKLQAGTFVETKKMILMK